MSPRLYSQVEVDHYAQMYQMILEQQRVIRTLEEHVNAQRNEIESLRDVLDTESL